MSEKLRDTHCNRCGIPITGASQLIGVCADCVQLSTLEAKRTKQRQPRYGFNRRTHGRPQS